MIANFVKENAFLSNFYMKPFEVNGVMWPSVEHYFQAMKTLDIDDRERIRTVATPSEAKRLGRKVTLREDWPIVKQSVMYTALLYKFSDPELKQMLLETGHEYLMEGNTWGDIYWGVHNGGGANMLGVLLMFVRSNILAGEL